MGNKTLEPGYAEILDSTIYTPDFNRGVVIGILNICDILKLLKRDLPTYLRGFFNTMIYK